MRAIKKISLSRFPTPLEAAPRLGKALGIERLWVKRDDCICLGGGGNKVRKLEYLVADALSKGARTLITDGGVQSNHARLTAAAAAKVGMKALLVLGAPELGDNNGNLILDNLFGADILFMEGASVKDMEEAMDHEAAKLSVAGKRPYIIPIGGSTPLGDLGYVDAVKELAEQADFDDPIIFAAVGSGGTLTGLLLGCRLYMPKAKVIGVAVAGGTNHIKRHMAECFKGAAELLGVEETLSVDDIDIIDDCYGTSYGVPCPGGDEAVKLAASTEGILLDPVYTGKAMYGLREAVKRDVFDKTRPVVFWHTGGSPCLYAFSKNYAKNFRN